MLAACTALVRPKEPPLEEGGHLMNARQHSFDRLFEEPNPEKNILPFSSPRFSSPASAVAERKRPARLDPNFILSKGPRSVFEPFPRSKDDDTVGAGPHLSPGLWIVRAFPPFARS